MNLVSPVHPATGRHHSADLRHGAGRVRWPSSSCRCRRCRRSISRPSRFRPSCRAPARRPWRPPWRRPLERHLGQIADVTEMTSPAAASARCASPCNSASTAISTAPRATSRRRSMRRTPTCRPACASNPTYSKVNPADAPILILVADLRYAVARASSTTRPRRCCRRSCRRFSGVGEVIVGGSSLPAVRVELDPQPLYQVQHRPGRRARRTRRRQRARPKGAIETATAITRSTTTTRPPRPRDYLPLIVSLQQRRRSTSVGSGRSNRFGAGFAQRRLGERANLRCC